MDCDDKATSQKTYNAFQSAVSTARLHFGVLMTENDRLIKENSRLRSLLAERATPEPDRPTPEPTTPCPECRKPARPLATLDGVCLPCVVDRLTRERDAALHALWVLARESDGCIARVVAKLLYAGANRQGSEIAELIRKIRPEDLR